MRGAAAFARLFRQGRRIEAEHLQLLAVPAGGPIGQVGYVIGKQQLKLAVDRNRLRRRLRAIVHDIELAPGAYLVSVSPAAAKCSFDELAIHVVKACRR